MNSNGMLDDELNRTIDRLLATGQPSGNPLLDDLAETVPAPSPLFQQNLEAQLLDTLSSDRRPMTMRNPDSHVIDVQQLTSVPEKRKRRKPSLTFAAAVTAAVLIGGMIFANIRSMRSIDQMERSLITGLEPIIESSATPHTDQANSLFITYTPSPIVEISEDDAAALTAATNLIQFDPLFYVELTATAIILEETQYYADFTSTAIPVTAAPNGMVITMTSAPILLPDNTRLISIPMSRFVVSLDYFVFPGDIVDLLSGDEVIAAGVMVMEILTNENAEKIVSLAVRYEDTAAVVEALQSTDTFVVKLILPTNATTTATLTLTPTPMLLSATLPPQVILPTLTATPTVSR